MIANSAALAAAVFVMTGLAVVAPPRVRLRERIEPYVAFGRVRLGTSATGSFHRSTVRPGPRSIGLARSVVPFRADAAGDATSDDRLARRLRLAWGDSTAPGPALVAQYRMRQLAATVGGGTVGVASGAILFGSASGALGLLCCFAVAGATHHRGRLDRAIARRRRLMRSEVPTVAQLLAVHLRTGHGPIESVRRVGDRCRGPVGMELRGAVRSIADGSTPLQVYEQLAGQTSEPTVARLYRLLVSSARTGGDIVDPLLALSNEIRAAQRSDVARSAVKRRSAMVIPLLVLVAPVMTLFVASALPFIVFGAT